MSSEKRFAMELPEDFDLIAGRGWLQKAAEKGHRGAEEFLQSEYMSAIWGWEGKIKEDKDVQNIMYDIAVKLVGLGYSEERGQGKQLQGAEFLRRGRKRYGLYR